MGVEKKIFPLVDLTTVSGRPGVYYLCDCNGCNEVSVNVEWIGIDKYDGFIYLVEKHHEDITNWTKIQKLEHNLTTSSGATILYDRAFSSRILGLYVDPGSCEYGIINAYVKGS